MLLARAVRMACVLLVAACPLAVARADEKPSAEARELLLKGRYAEAAELYGMLPDAESLAAALGLARCHAAQGEYDEAAKLLSAAAEKHPEAAAPLAELAQLAVWQGDYDQAGKHVAAAIKLDEKQLLARWLQAELARLSGDMEAADKGYKWLVDHYNAADEFQDPDDLRYIGLAAAQFARWNRLPDQFSFLVNTLYPDALELEKDYWPAHLEMGLLFLEKYNQAEATRALKAALAINANSADVHAALAELAIQSYELDAAALSIRNALAINPRHLRATLMRADLHLANFDARSAAEVLEAALRLNPVYEPALGRLAAAYAITDGTGDDLDGTRIGKMVVGAEKRNPRCGDFYYALAEALDKYRKFPDAARYFDRATEVMPQHVGSRGQAGLMYMRLGEEERARKLLEESFDIDPFNVRVSNSIKVLEVLDDYATLETDHFIIRYDGQKDRILARYAAQYLEEIYPELCRRLDYEPQEKSLFEIFNRARNTDGHGWFSARMVGLPAIHTIGACSGKIVALTSPTSMKQQFNWARVLRHEFVHVINLQQTNFNIPHWFTEGLAVMLEDLPRSAEWNEMLARRVAEGKTFNLDSINLGFIRPSSSEDWQMAYCQAELYAEYMVEKFGEDSLGKMLAAYRDSLSTTEAIARSFSISQEEFERGYKDYVAKIVAEIKTGRAAGPSLTFSELQKRHAAEPDDADIAAQLAVAHLQRKAFPEAGKLADQVLAQQAGHPLATFVKARLLLLIGQETQAREMLEKCLDPEKPQTEVLRLLAGLRFQAEDYRGAQELYELGRKQEPLNPQWTKLLVRVHLESGDEAALRDGLTRMAEAEADNLLVRKKLAQLALKAKDYPAAADWANQCIQIDVMDAGTHQMLAEAFHGQREFSQAARQYETAIELEPTRLALRMALAATRLAAGEVEQARQALEALLKANPDYPGARALLESLPEADQKPRPKR